MLLQYPLRGGSKGEAFVIKIPLRGIGGTAPNLNFDKKASLLQYPLRGGSERVAFESYASEGEAFEPGGTGAGCL